jgi:hypothetical protein
VGLAATLIKAQVFESAPVTTKYSTFTGGFGIIVGAVGLAGLFIDAIPDLATMALDGLAGLLFLAGGIAWAVGIKGISCSNREDFEKMVENGLLNLGKFIGPNGPIYGVYRDTNNAFEIFAKLEENCKKGFADEIFQFLAFGLGVALVGVGFVRWRKGGPTSYV